MLSKIKYKLEETIKSELLLLKYRSQRTVNVKYFTEVLNWGDMINIDIIEHVSHAKVVSNPLGHRIHMLGIGSVLVTANKNSIVWGAGFISANQKVKAKPFKVCAVRGPKSREMLLAQNIDCPEVYGDPALLLPELYQPNIQKNKKYKLGIIPHYDHKSHPWIKMLEMDSQIKIIDIQQDGVNGFIDDIVECDVIASSSLHGIIAADAYGIGNCRLLLANMNSFKFDDYHLGIGVENYNTINIMENPTTSSQQVIDNCILKAFKFDGKMLKSVFPSNLLLGHK